MSSQDSLRTMRYGHITSGIFKERPNRFIAYCEIDGNIEKCHMKNTGRRIAIFVNGCFWHHCPRCDLPMPKSHSDFWQTKIERNIQRDERKNRELTEAGWTVITIWECELKKERDEVTTRLRAFLEHQSR